MKKFTTSLFVTIFLFVTLITFGQEGTKQHIEAQDGGEAGRMSLVLFNGADVDQTLHTYTAAPTGRIYFALRAGDKAYFGANMSNTQLGGGTTMDFRVRGPIVGDPRTAATAPIVFGPQLTPGTAIGNAGEGLITSNAQALAGAAEIGAAGGYDGIDLFPTAPTTDGIYYIEFENLGNGNQRAWFEYFDISIEDAAGVDQSGRLFSYQWSLYNRFQGTGFFSADVDFYGYHSADSVATQLQMDNVIPGGFSLSLNEFGIGTSGDRYEDRKSDTYANAGGSNAVEGYYPIHFTEPDQYFWPPATLEPVITIENAVCTDVGGIVFELNKESLVEIILDYDGGDELFTPGTADRSLFYDIQTPGLIVIPWDGLDGFGNTIPVGSNVPIVIRLYLGEFQMPLGDFEANPNGFNGNNAYPAFTAGALRFYHDDTNFPASGDNPEILNETGCMANCHRWEVDGGTTYGNQRWINTRIDSRVFLFSMLVLLMEPE